MVERRLVGRAAAPGLVRGPVVVLETMGRPRWLTGSRAQERTALLAALEAARAEVEALAAGTTGEAADMVGFQAAMLADDELARPALESVAAGTSAPDAWEDAMAAEAAGYVATGETGLAARTADLDDIRDRVLAHLSAGPATARPSPGAIIAAADLPLSRFLAVDWSQGGGIVLTGGSPAGHVAMLARARGVPMVVGVGGAAPLLASREALVDATAGEVVLDPDEATRAAFAARMRDAAATQSRAAPSRAGPVVTLDGTRIALSLTIDNAAELDGLDPSFCDGIGLVRTELLFHGCGGMPGEDVQYGAYRRILGWARGRTVVVRVLDAGGDKPMPGLTPIGENNPFLGLRGIRLLLRSAGLFGTQLRALVRAAVHGDLRVLLPMVTIPEEFEAARTLLDGVVDALTGEGIPACRPMLGIMVEVPAAAIAIDRFDAEFFSIGSNDLTQYVTAAGRDVGSVSSLADPLNPAVLRLIETVARHGRATGREVSLCGDAAAEPRCIEPLLRAGLRSLSVSAGSLGRARQAIAAVDLGPRPS